MILFFSLLCADADPITPAATVALCKATDGLQRVALVRNMTTAGRYLTIRNICERMHRIAVLQILPCSRYVGESLKCLEALRRQCISLSYRERSGDFPLRFPGSICYVVEKRA
jgi:hypothetical protein